MAPQSAGHKFDLVVVGTGFASTFFLYRYLQLSRPDARVLVLERGERRDHRWHMANQTVLEQQARDSFVNRSPAKPWVVRLTFGGCSNCWWACTPRLLPEDFRLKSLFGVGTDWPISYGDLEPYYCDAEDVMAVAGPDDSPVERSRPYPQPPHRFSDPDRILKNRFPDKFFAQPTARPTQPLPSGRPRCCANGVCSLCPIDSKFTIANGMAQVYDDPRVTLRLGADVTRVDLAGSVARGVTYRVGRDETSAAADLVALGANAMFNPAILRRSGLTDAAIGRGLMEQVSSWVEIDLDGVDNFQGSTSITGHGYMLYGGDRRRTRAGALIESWNVPELRDERGRWRQRLRLKVIFEDLPRPENHVGVRSSDGRPETVHGGPSPYSMRGIASLEQDLVPILNALPVERYSIYRPPESTEAHILGTTAMGLDPSESVVDRDLVHHRYRNLLVLGGGAFPTTSPANPTLTICALSLRAADRLFRSH